MKKLFAFISLLLLLSCSVVFAEVTVAKNADGTVNVTFFYGNPRATEVLLAGDFNNWQDGAEAMTKTEKGFELTKTFKATDELRYKFISDGNWTTDLKAPDFVDDGFGGKNSHVVIADMLGDDGGDAGAAKAKINFISWTMIGLQGNYTTQGAVDKTEKGMDLDSVSIGFKSYNKFAGNFLPNCPVYIEIALSETEMEDYAGNDRVNYLFKKNGFDNNEIEFKDGFRDFLCGIFGNPVAYMAQAKDNTKGGVADGPGSRPFLGHLKFGWNTPYINILTGFNYAKPDVRQAVTWKTTTGNWDAGYTHVGGFNVFSLGSKAVAAMEEKTGITFDIGFAPNKSGDRKGTKYGYWGWFGLKKGELAVDFQTNGMYNGEYMFTDPVEHDFIVGVKDTFEVGDGKLRFAVDALAATHQVATEDIIRYNTEDGNGGNAVDYFGYSTDVWWRSREFNGHNIALNAQVGYKASNWNVDVEYRMRGAQASMLFVRENHDDGTFDLSDQLGVLNSQRVAFNGWVKPTDGLQINLGVNVEWALSEIKLSDEKAEIWNSQLQPWWKSRRFIEEDEPLVDRTGGAEVTFKPALTYAFENPKITIGAYADMNLCAYKWSDEVKGNKLDDDDLNKYGATDSVFRLKYVGAQFSIKPDLDGLKGVDVYYGYDGSNVARMFHAITAQFSFPYDMAATLSIGIKTENTLSVDDAESNVYGKFDSDTNNPFAIALGFSKRFKKAKKPILYAQFLYNMDPFKHFGDGQDQLNIDRSNLGRSWQKEGVGKIDPVDVYDGRAAWRVGCRWDI